MKNIFKKKEKIIIVGGNFAGLAAAKKISRFYDVTVIDPHPYFEFLPNIHEIVSRNKKPHQLRHNKSQFVRNQGHQFIQDQVVGIDPEKAIIETALGKSLNYDKCIVAVGGCHNTFGIPGAEKWVMPFKTVAQCQLIGDKIEKLVQDARKASITLVGSGMEGIEALGEILRFVGKSDKVSIQVIENQNRILPSLPLVAGMAIQTACTDYNVQFSLNTRVTSISKKSITLSSGEKLPSDLTIWTGGLKPHKFMIESGLQKQNETWAPVAQTLKSTYSPDIFIAGDAAQLPTPYAKQAYNAIEMGALAGENIIRSLKNKKLKAFKPFPKPMLLTFGNLNTFFIFQGLVISGIPLAPLKEAIYELVMFQFAPTSAFFEMPNISKRLVNSLFFVTGSQLNAIAMTKRIPGITIL